MDLSSSYGQTSYDNVGRLHNETGPSLIRAGEADRYFLYGFEITKDHFCSHLKHRVSNGWRWGKSGAITEDSINDQPTAITDHSGHATAFWYKNQLQHRDVGPAILISYPDGISLKSFWERGVLLNTIRVNSNVSQGQADPILNCVPILTQGEKMSELNGNTPTRVSQLTTGAKHGLRKGAVKVVSEKASKAIVGALPVSGLPAERFVQLLLLTAAAEVAERVPAAVANKVGLTEERRNAFGSLNRFLSGELIGRDAVELVSTLSPLLVEAFGRLSSISAEEIQESAEAMSVPELDTAEQEKRGG